MPTTNMAPEYCEWCGNAFVSTGLGTGYVVVQSSHLCYDCCAVDDKKFMVEHGEISLYLTCVKDSPYETFEVSNWPGSLRFKVCSWSRGEHNWGSRIDVWFRGPDGKIWWGWKCDNGIHECINVRRTKLEF